MTATTSKQTYKRNELSDMDDAMPLDYTFKKLTSLIDLKFEKPREGRVGKTPLRGPTKRFLTKGLWLNNNNLASIVGIDAFVESVIEVPEAIAWIDFSFNAIKDIDPALLKFPNLTILYFHGNQIEEMETVLQLRVLKKLKRLTLHGNPVAKTESYRSCIIHIMPQICNLDFAPVLNRERMAPAPVGILNKYTP